MGDTMSEIEFPFKRQTWYALTELIIFEDHLLSARRQNKQFDNDLRCSRETWMQLRTKELYPLLCFAKQTTLATATQFQICAEGADADIELKDIKSKVRRLQITLAGPIWDSSNLNWGKGHKYEMEKLNSEGQVSGWGPYKKNDESIVNREKMISTEERNPIYLAGLIKALKGKRNHRIPDCDLIVRAVNYCEAMNLQTFIKLASAALNEISLLSFHNIYILDCANKYFVSKNAAGQITWPP